MKQFEKMRRWAVITIFTFVASGLGYSPAVFAGNSATQSASTAQATTISVVAKAVDTDVTTITFPQGAPGATISNPSNNVDGVAGAQVLSATASEPVVRLKNTSAGALTVTLEITSWANGVAASEDYELVAPTPTTTAAVAQALSANGNAASVNTTYSIASSQYGALYLELVLSGLANKTGTSSLSILGQS